MIQRDLSIIAKSTLIIVGTVAFLYPALTSPEGRGLVPVLLGRVLLSTVFASLMFSFDFSFSIKFQTPQLLPQTQLALWAAGIVAIFLATNGLRWFEPNATTWVFMAGALTVACRAGLAWLWHQVVPRSSSQK